MSIHIMAPVDGDNLKPILIANIAKDSHLMTDGAMLYRPIGKKFARHEHTCAAPKFSSTRL